MSSRRAPENPEAETPSSRRSAVQQRRRQQRTSHVRLVSLVLVGCCLVAGAVALLLFPWEHGEQPAAASAKSTAAVSSDRPFSLAPGSEIVLSDPSTATAEATFSSTPRPTPTRSFAAPGANMSGKATFHILEPAPGDSGRQGRVIKYSVAVEDGAQLDESQANNMVRATFSDPRGWEVKEKVHYVQVGAKDAAQAQVKIIFASPGTTNDECYPIVTLGEYSCSPAGTGKVVINVRRWLLPVDAYKAQPEEFQSMVLNHSIGYTLNKPAATCPGAGKPAPIMQTQTIGMEGCTPNAWPSVA